jgi:hypothetical protein
MSTTTTTTTATPKPIYHLALVAHIGTDQVAEFKIAKDEDRLIVEQGAEEIEELINSSQHITSLVKAIKTFYKGCVITPRITLQQTKEN